jgi:endonuclease I
MEKLLFSFLLLPTFLYSQFPVNYYEGTSTLQGYELKSKLHDIISSKTITWHYGDLPNFYSQTDVDHFYDYGSTNDTYLLDLYSNNPTGTTAYHYTNDNLISSAGAEGLGYNREHMMPQSSFNSNYPMYSDLFFVIPTDARINQLRSNYPYGIAGSINYHTFTNGSKISKNGTPNSGYTGRVYEPHPEFKGDIARSLLYYVVRYEGKLSSFNFYNGTSPANDTSPLDGSEERAYEDWFLSMLLQWHTNDPVSQREIDRNNVVYSIQKNRNPFIDHPEWVNKIWIQNPTNVFPEALGDLTVSRVSSYFVNLNWTPSTDRNILGYKIYQNGIPIGYAKTTKFIVDHLSPGTLYQFTVRVYYQNYTESTDSNLLVVTTLNQDVYAKDLMITKYLEGTDQNTALEIANRTGHPVDLGKYRISTQFYSGTNFYFPDPYELEGVVENNQAFVILNPKAFFSCITNDQAKFVSAAPQMTFDGSNYLELRYLLTTVDAIGTKYLNNFSTLADVSLFRNNIITDPSIVFNLEEWQVYPSDYCNSLGFLSALESPIGKKKENFIYPNPVGNILLMHGMQFNKIKNASIYDLSGKEVLNWNTPFKNSNSLEVQKLLPGVYFLKVDGQSLKFIKK